MTFVSSLLFGMMLSMTMGAETGGLANTKSRDCCSKAKRTTASEKRVPSAPNRYADPVLTSLEESLKPLTDQFNGGKGRIRVLALLSPTCSGCIYAALGVAKSVVEEFPDADPSVMVVWEPMLPSDNYAEAMKSSKIFRDAGVRQFWDPNRSGGVAMSRVVMPSHAREKALVAVANNPRLEHLSGFLSRSPETTPIWDAVFFFEGDALWGEGPPTPKEWVKQTMFYDDERADGYTGEFWKNDVTEPSFLGDWFVELSRSMQRTTGLFPIDTGLGLRPGRSLASVVSYLKSSPCTKTKTATTKTPCCAKPASQNVVVKERSPVTKNKRSGCCSKKKPTKAAQSAMNGPVKMSEGESEQAMNVLQGGGPMMIRRLPKAQEASYPDTIAGLMARAFIEAFNSGDPEQVRVAAEKYRSTSALESRSMDERLEQYTQLYKSWGRLEVQHFEEQDDGSLTLTVKPDRGYAGLNMMFSFGNAGGKIDEIRITPVMLADDSSDEANRGVMGEVTVLSESIEPLRDHFNAHKDKHRFIAILSPT